MELLLSACLNYAKMTTLIGKPKRVVYAAAMISDDMSHRLKSTPDGDYEEIQLCTDDFDVVAYIIDTNQVGSDANTC
jgi:hypothetical protein